MRGHALESLANIYWHYRSAKGAAWPSTSALLLALILKAIVLQEGRTHGQFSRWVDCKRHVVPQTQSCHCSGIPRHRLLPQLWKQCCWRYLESDCLTRTTHARNNSTLFYPPNLKKYKTRKRTTLDIRYGIFKTQQVILLKFDICTGLHPDGQQQSHFKLGEHVVMSLINNLSQTQPVISFDVFAVVRFDRNAHERKAFT